MLKQCEGSHAVAEAIALCRPYADILGGTLELDIRVVDPDEATA